MQPNQIQTTSRTQQTDTEISVDYANLNFYDLDTTNLPLSI